MNLRYILKKKTQTAISNNKFDEEVIKINNNGNSLDNDEYPKINLKISDLEKLKTVFKKKGTVTSGNSSGINDGAAALFLTNLEEAEKKSINPLAKIVSWACVGVDPSLMGLGPIEAVRKAIKNANWKLSEVDLFCIVYAFDKNCNLLRPTCGSLRLHKSNILMLFIYFNKFNL